jgi:hypothetical protein
MKPTTIGPFSLAKANDSANMIWPLQGSDLEGDLMITISLARHTSPPVTYEIGLIEFVQRLFVQLLEAVIFKRSETPESFGVDFPEFTIEVNDNGTARFVFNGVATDTEYDAISLLRETFLLGDAELLPIMSDGDLLMQLKAIASAPILGLPLGVRSKRLLFPDAN